MSLVSGYAQDIGSRDRQEDHLAEKRLGNMLVTVLADGMGGYDGGERASQTVTQGFIRFIEQQAQRYPLIPDLLVDAVYSANAQLAQIKQDTASNMGSTLVALVARANHVWWVSVGDSLLYLWRDGRLQKLNAEHSHYQDLRQKVFLGEISTAQAANDPERDGLTSALMGKYLKYVDVSRFGIDVKVGDVFLLASDGLETLTPEQISAVLGKISNPKQIADTLVKQVKQANSPHQDNVSVVVLGDDAQHIDSSRTRIAIATSSSKNSLRKPLLILLSSLLVGVGLGLAAGKLLFSNKVPASVQVFSPDQPVKEADLGDEKNVRLICESEQKRAGIVCRMVFAGKNRSLEFCPQIEEMSRKLCEANVGDKEKPILQDVRPPFTAEQKNKPGDVSGTKQEAVLPVQKDQGIKQDGASKNGL